jgi:MoxR-like ATPase
MQEQQVTIERETFNLEQPFIVIASQIPFGSPGTSPLSDVQKDRFMFRIWSATSSIKEEELILKNIDAISEPHIKAVTNPQDIVRFQADVKGVYIADSIRNYILQIVDKLRHHQDVQLGPSTRAGIALLTGARSLAFLHGREFVIPDDVKALLVPALSHRLQITAEAEMADISPESTIKEVATSVPVPKMNHE